MNWYDNLNKNPFSPQGVPLDPEREYYEIESRNRQYKNIKKFISNGIDPIKLKTSRSVLILKGEYGTGKSLIEKFYNKWINKKTNSISCYLEVPEFKKSSSVGIFFNISLYVYRLRPNLIKKVMINAEKNNLDIMKEKLRIERKIEEKEKSILKILYSPFVKLSSGRDIDIEKSHIGKIFTESNHFFELIKGYYEICREEGINSIFLFFDEVESIVGQTGLNLDKEVEECAKIFLGAIRKLMDNSTKYKIKIILGTTSIAWNKIIELHPAYERRIDLGIEELEQIDLKDIEDLIIHYLDSVRIDKTKILTPFTKQSIKMMHRFRLGNIGKIISFAYVLLNKAIHNKCLIDLEFVKNVIFEKNIISEEAYDNILKKAIIRPKSTEKEIFDYLLFENFAPLLEEIEIKLQKPREQITESLDYLFDNGLIDREPKICIKDDILSSFIKRKTDLISIQKIGSTSDEIRRVLQTATNIANTHKIYFLSKAIEYILIDKLSGTSWNLDLDSKWNNEMNKKKKENDFFKNVIFKKIKLLNKSSAYARFGTKSGLLIFKDLSNTDNPLIDIDEIKEFYNIFLESNSDFILFILYTKSPVSNIEIITGEVKNFLYTQNLQGMFDVNWLKLIDIIEFITIPDMKDARLLNRRISKLILTYGVFVDKKLIENDMKIYSEIHEKIIDLSYSEYRFETKLTNVYLNASYPLPNFKILKGNKTNAKYQEFYEKLFDKYKYDTFFIQDFAKVSKTMKPEILEKSDLIDLKKEKLSILFNIKRKTIFDEYILQIIREKGDVVEDGQQITYKELFNEVFKSFKNKKIRKDDTNVLNFYLKIMEIRGIIEQIRIENKNFIRISNINYCELIQKQFKHNQVKLNSIKEETDIKIEDYLIKNESLIKKWNESYSKICSSEDPNKIEEFSTELKELYSQLLEIHDNVSKEYSKIKGNLENKYKALPNPIILSNKLKELIEKNNIINKKITTNNKIEENLKTIIIKEFKKITGFEELSENIKEYKELHEIIENRIEKAKFQNCKENLNKLKNLNKKIQKNFEKCDQNIKKYILSSLKTLRNDINTIIKDISKLLNNVQVSEFNYKEIEDIIDRISNFENMIQGKNFYELKVNFSSQCFSSPFFYTHKFQNWLINTYQKYFEPFRLKIVEYKDESTKIKGKIEEINKINEVFNKAFAYSKSIIELYNYIKRFFDLISDILKFKKEKLIKNLTPEAQKIYKLLDENKNLNDLIENARIEKLKLEKILKTLYENNLIEIYYRKRLI
ncbi:MAG: hypothetical protein ACTSRG_25210 [Candidatus Helarchaeota archaeon]